MIYSLLTLSLSTYANTKDWLEKAIYNGFRQYNEREFDKIMQYWLMAIALLRAIVTGY